MLALPSRPGYFPSKYLLKQASQYVKPRLGKNFPGGDAAGRSTLVPAQDARPADCRSTRDSSQDYWGSRQTAVASAIRRGSGQRDRGTPRDWTAITDLQTGPSRPETIP